MGHNARHILVVGAGYVGLSNALVLSRHNQVTLADIDPKRIALLKQGRSPIEDKDIAERLPSANLSFASIDPNLYKANDIVVIAVPTNYDPSLHHFDTVNVDRVIEEAISVNPMAKIVVKSTVPVGYTCSKAAQYPKSQIYFSPEFLREGKALYDNLHPSRIIVGLTSNDQGRPSFAAELLAMFKSGSDEVDVPGFVMGAKEAEAVKLFANTYLALRIAYFNELDSFAESQSLNSRQIIAGVSGDPRIGDYYNNPSFGYGGYCLPKDTKQLKANFDGIPNDLIGAIIASNNTRKDFIAEQIMKKAKGMEDPLIGVYRLTMKSHSDNFRESSILGIIERLQEKQVRLLIYEPLLKRGEFAGVKVTEDLKEFKSECDLVISNRMDAELQDIADKVYTRDLYRRD